MFPPLKDISTHGPILLVFSLPISSLIFMDHFAPIERIWHSFEPCRMVRFRHTSLLRGQLSLLLSFLPGCPLFLLEPDLLQVSLVPPSLLHQPLIRPESGVCRSRSFLRLVELTGKSAKVVIFFRSFVVDTILPEQFGGPQLLSSIHLPPFYPGVPVTRQIPLDL